MAEVVKTPGTSEGDGELVAEDALEPASLICLNKLFRL